MLYGFDVGGTKIAFSVYEKEQRHYHKQVPTPTDSYEKFLKTLESLVLTADQKFGKSDSLGIGIPGNIHPKTALTHCVNIPCLNNKPLGIDLEKRLHRPVYIENDANCFVLSEVYGGAANQCTSVFGVILGTGCGSGLYLNGKLLQGARHLAGEWGHTQIPFLSTQLSDDTFPLLPCNCGLTGCLDNYLSGRGLSNIHQHYSNSHLPGEEIIKQYNDQQPEAQKSVSVYFELLACALGSVINFLDPEAFVIGGGLSNFAELYLQIPPRLKKYTMHTQDLPPLFRAKYGSTSGARGAAILSFINST